MARLDVSDGFDVHDYRSKLKLLRQDAGSMSLANREGLGCPACGDPFERLFVSDDETVTFSSAPEGPICLARTDDRLLVMTH
ncbi:flagella cluster protein [Halobaculum sp. WSA2]|uniref:Flagella cluster protein n=1 Tax=Halobaculum saliterrae TaxID=2073113 RepID=A0A6B0SLV8_9EURY|nr:flagella cluster protein [Halobaculum saliterrae]MXR39888.1 flagella cluster protein [Halobaculum saliterrae]